MIQKIEVLAADVDMTLSSKGSPLPEITIHALKELHERNVKIGLATGREITEMEKTKGIFWNLGFEFDFIIGMNGGMIYDRNLEQSFTMDMLSIEEMKEVLTFLMPIIEEIAGELEGKANFVKVNADEEPELARNLQVEVLPTFVILKDGEVVDRKIGFLPKGDLQGAIESKF